MNLFLDRLHGDKIGFSVLGIFVIEKNTILTVSRMLPGHSPQGAPNKSRPNPLSCCLLVVDVV